MSLLFLYDLCSGKKKVFIPADTNRVTLYVCGPTVYNYIHIGNARPAIVFDVLFRVLQKIFPVVVYARNITDIDDKIINKALEEAVDVSIITARFIDAYESDMCSLLNLSPTLSPMATHHIPQMINIIETLILNGHAYLAENHVLFHVPSMKDYGRLTKKSLDDLISGARVDVAPYKKYPADFVLWKPSTFSQPGWDSPWGRGRPGWHIECTAMIKTHLGVNIDIHGGGQDLSFPHHENELAQGVCSHPGSYYVNYWIHNGYITLDEEKMSKSLGNFITVHSLLEKSSGEVLRYALLTSHYRSPLSWSDDLVAQSKKSLARLYLAIREAFFPPVSLQDVNCKDLGIFWDALLDDLNTPLALSVLHGWVTDLNKSDDFAVRTFLAQKIRSAGQMLGILQEDPDKYFQSDKQDHDQINLLVEQRDLARKAKNFAEADHIRQTLLSIGVELEDTSFGTKWRFI